MTQEVHHMEFHGTHEGTDEWVCPTCGRILLIEWVPFHKETVEPGDETAIHTGGKGIDVKGMDISQ